MYSWPLWLFSALTLVLLLSLAPRHAFADGGAPNLAYVAGTAAGITTIDVAQQQVTGTFSPGGDPHIILLSSDGRFLYVTQPAFGRVSIIAARNGKTLCTASLPGQPTLLALGPASGLLYAAGNGAPGVSALDAGNCAVRHTFKTLSPVYGLAAGLIGSGSDIRDQLWVSGTNSLTIFDQHGQQLGSVPIADGPQYLSLPGGYAVYVTTRQGGVDAVDIGTRRVVPLLTGGKFGPMDYDAITGEIYAPDQQNNQVDVLTPLYPGTGPAPHEPNRVIHVDGAPLSVAITSDGQLGFVALSAGKVVMLDIPGRTIVNTISVGGNPRFIITGLYPPLIGTTPQEVPVWNTALNIAAYVLVIALFVAPILLLRRYTLLKKRVK